MSDIKVEQSKHQVITHDRLTFVVIGNNTFFNIEDIRDFDAVIIEAADIDYTLFVLKKIRQHPNHIFYLKPIFLLKANIGTDPFIMELVDGTVFSLEQLKLVAQLAQNIKIKSADLKIQNAISYEAQMIVKLISYAYSRDIKEINPIPYYRSGIGYSYPILSVNLGFKEEHIVLDILKLAESEGILKSEFYNRTHVCSNCKGGFLSYREVCPKCDSANSESQDMVHHFRCAYVGPIEDFQNELDDQLNCPKCNKTLRHIGVDYDKPSVLHTCNNCGNKFQDYHVKVKCMSCSYDNKVEQLIGLEIPKYSLTKKAEISAINGYNSTSKDIEEIIGTVKLDTFKTMLKYEIERLRQTDGNSNIAAIHLSNSGEIYSKVGKEKQKILLKDLIDLIRTNIRTSDIITFYDSSTILLSINDIPLRVGRNILREICQFIAELIESNFQDLKLETQYAIEEVNYKLSHELQIQKLINNIF